MNFKKLLLALLILFLTENFIFSQGLSTLNTKEKGIESSYYFNSPDGIAKFNISTTKIAVKFDEKISSVTLNKLISENPELKNFDVKSLHKFAGYSIVNINSKVSKPSDLEKLTTKLGILKEVISAHPLLIYEDGTEQIVTDKIMIKLFNKSDFSQLQKDAIKFNFTIGDTYAYDDKVYFIDVNPTSTLSPIAIANTLSESKKYSTAEPIFVKLLERMNTNDPFLNYQWSLNNTGSTIQYSGIPGSDMNVLNAWGISTGSNSIKVAIIDEGVDLNHPDLVANLLPGFDATGQGSGGGPQGNDAHGTACAGIVAARGNNNIGIAGIAYNTKIVPVRIAYSNGSNWVTNDTWISTAIDWSWNQGQADVLSNSWGGGSPSTLINDAINRAVTQGRANKGAAVLFAAGNNNGAVFYPATNNNTISVIAMSMCNQRKSPSSCDGETFWGSNYGLNADIAAPGVKIYTTDISGSAGYEAGDYESTFNGTSSACPNAAGVMALILSVNPNLTYAQARQILESTCEKTGGYSYNGNVSGQPNGTWSADLGYGRVNAFAALQLAAGQTCTGTPVSNATLASHNNLCAPNNVTLTLQTSYPLSGTTYQWQESVDGNNYTNVSGANNNFYITNITSSKWFRCIVTCTGSVNSTPVLITYLDQTIYNYPHTQNFNTNTLPCGWSVQNVNNDNFTWAARTTGPRSPSYSMSYLKNAALAANDWLFSPPLNMNAGTNYAVRFWYKGSSVTLPEKLEVKWGNSNTDAGMTSAAIYSNTNINTTSYQAINSAIISPTSNGSYYVGFKIFSNANMGNLMIDDITFDIVTTCTIPTQGGTIAGPSTIQAGNSTISTWTLSGNTGIDLQWQISSNNGTSWSDLTGHISTTMNNFIVVPGNYLLRVKVGSLNCPDAYSNSYAVNVTPRIGDFFSNPIIASGLHEEYLNNGPQSGFGNDYTGPNAQPSNDVFLRYTTGTCTDSLIIGTCGSAFDTYVHVLDANGVHLFSVDDTPYCGQQAVIFMDVNPTTVYYFVLEGWNTSQGEGGIGIYEIMGTTINATITPNGSTTICAGDNLTLTASTGVSYLWNNGATSQSIIVNTGGTYSVTVSDGNNCSGSTSLVVTSNVPTLWYQDSDGDGFGNINVMTLSCTQPLGYIGNNTDCDDNNANINSLQQYFIDTDGDGFGSTTTALLCSSTPPSGYSINNTDCDDNNSAINALQQYFVDADGDGFGSTTTALLCSATPPSGYSINNTDCDDNNVNINSLQQYFIDTDGDGYGSATTAMLCSATAPSGYASNNTDCDDNNVNINSPQQYFVDADGDGYGSATTAMLCSTTAPSGYSTNNTDCDDNNATINTPITWYQDNDGDGFGQIELTLISCFQPSGYVSDYTDCNDNDALIHEQNIFYSDMDEDGYGGSVVGSFCLLTPPDFWSANNGDCNDNNVNINPGQIELCGNNLDDNCNLIIDESCCTLTANGIVTNAMCSNVYNGSIDVSVLNGVSPFTFLWSNNETTEDIIGLSIGNYTITVTDNGGCTASSTFTVSHNNQAPQAATAINGPSGTCRNQNNIIFSINPIAGATSYTWVLPNGANGTSTTNTISVNFGNNFNTGNICIRAVNDCGQSANYCRQVVRYTSAPAVPGVISGLKQGVCPNTTYSYTITPVNNATSYIWTAPNNATIVSGQGTTTVTVSFDVNFGTSGTLSVRSSNCIGNSGNRNLSLQRNPAQPSAISGPSPVCKNQQGIVYSVTNVPEYTYNWIVPSGCTIVSGQGTNSVTVNWGTNSGTIAVQSLVTCAVSPYRSRNITANTCGNAPEIIENEMVLTSLFEIYPNPNNGNTKIYLNTEKESSYEISIYNIQGQIMKKQIGQSVKGDNYFDIDISSYQSGLYFVRYSDTNGLLRTKAVIKE